MKAVLILAYEFPPLNVGGSQRPYRFARYLRAEGYLPIVVTPEAILHGRRVDSDYDDSAIAPKYCEILRTNLDASPRHSRLKRAGYTSILGDEATRWRKYCLAAAQDAARIYNLVAVIATVPPFSISALGQEIADLLRLPFILDLRDAWSQWVITPYASRLHYLLTKRHEARALRTATRVITTSEETRRQLLSIHPDISASKLVTITNSFEPSCETGTPPPLRKVGDSDRFTIGYVGSFYYEPYQRAMMFAPWWRRKPHQVLQYVPRREDWLYRSPEFFFRALAGLRREAPASYSRLDVKFVGVIPSWLPEMITKHQLENKVTLIGPVSRARSLELQRSFDALLITSSKVIGGRDYSIAGKTFEYISLGKPIAAFVCEGAQRDLLERTGLAQICDPDDPAAAISKLREIVEGQFVRRTNSEEIARLSIGHCVAELADLLREVQKHR